MKDKHQVWEARLYAYRNGGEPKFTAPFLPAAWAKGAA